MTNFERKYSPGYCHMICIGKTKSTSEEGLFDGVSLNKELMSGPDQMNSLIGVLVHFQQDKVHLVCDE